MTDLSNDRMEKLLAEATPGPWRVGPVDDTVVTAPDGSEVAAIDGDYNEPDLWPIMEANARIIALAPDLAREVLALRAEVARLREAMVSQNVDLEHPDDAAVDRFATTMKGKLAQKRLQGRGGWEGPDCTAEILSRLLREHVEKGDPLDVGNLAMMLHQRGERISALTPAPEASDTRDQTGVGHD